MASHAEMQKTWREIDFGTLPYCPRSQDSCFLIGMSSGPIPFQRSCVLLEIVCKFFKPYQAIAVIRITFTWATNGTVCIPHNLAIITIIPDGVKTSLHKLRSNQPLLCVRQLHWYTTVSNVQKRSGGMLLIIPQIRESPTRGARAAEWRVSVAWLRVKKRENVSIVKRRETEIGQ